MAKIDEILGAEDWQARLCEWIGKLSEESGAAEHFRQERVAAERARIRREMKELLAHLTIKEAAMARYLQDASRLIAALDWREIEELLNRICPDHETTSDSTTSSG